MEFIRNLFWQLLQLEKRKHRRIPCTIKTHFCAFLATPPQRGSATITDIHEYGMCCNNLSIFHENKEIPIKKNSKIELYLSLSDKNGKKIAFEVIGKIRSILKKNIRSNSQRFGVKIIKLKAGNKKDWKNCIKRLREKP